MSEKKLSVPLNNRNILACFFYHISSYRLCIICSVFLNFYLSIHATTFDTNIPEWMLEQISNDLRPFTDGIKTIELDALMQDQQKQGNNFYLVRFTINDQKIAVFYLPTDHPGVIGRINMMTEALTKLASIVTLPSVDFIVSMLDCLDGVSLSVPVFAFANDPTLSSGIILMPDFEALIGHQNFLSEVEKGNSQFPWQSKTNQIIWRGAMTGYPWENETNKESITPPRMGGVFTVENFLQFPRTMAVTLSLQFPDLINARYTALSQCSECSDIHSHFQDYFDKYIPVSQHIAFKYQLLIDGNTTAYSRTYWQLFSNSVIFKQSSNATQWYYRAIKPYVHYIPVNSDLSNLTQMIHWAIQHDDLAKEISLEAQRFAINNLTQFHIMQYMYLLLSKYSRLQK